MWYLLRVLKPDWREKRMFGSLLIAISIPDLYIEVFQLARLENRSLLRTAKTPRNASHGMETTARVSVNWTCCAFIFLQGIISKFLQIPKIASPVPFPNVIQTCRQWNGICDRGLYTRLSQSAHTQRQAKSNKLARFFILAEKGRPVGSYALNIQLLRVNEMLLYVWHVSPCSRLSTGDTPCLLVSDAYDAVERLEWRTLSSLITGGKWCDSCCTVAGLPAFFFSGDRRQHSWLAFEQASSLSQTPSAAYASLATQLHTRVWPRIRSRLEVVLFYDGPQARRFRCLAYCVKIAGMSATQAYALSLIQPALSWLFLFISFEELRPERIHKSKHMFFDTPFKGCRLRSESLAGLNIQAFPQVEGQARDGIMAIGPSYPGPNHDLILTSRCSEPIRWVCIFWKGDSRTHQRDAGHFGCIYAAILSRFALIVRAAVLSEEDAVEHLGTHYCASSKEVEFSAKPAELQSRSDLCAGIHTIPYERPHIEDRQPAINSSPERVSREAIAAYEAIHLLKSLLIVFARQYPRSWSIIRRTLPRNGRRALYPRRSSQGWLETVMSVRHGRDINMVWSSLPLIFDGTVKSKKYDRSCCNDRALLAIENPQPPLLREFTHNPTRHDYLTGWKSFLEPFILFAGCFTPSKNMVHYKYMTTLPFTAPYSLQVLHALADFRCHVFAATDCIDDVAIFIPLGHTHVFIGNVRASIRADKAHEIIHLKNPQNMGEELAKGMAKFRDDPANSIPDHAKFICTKAQGAELKEVVKKRVTQIVERAYPEGLGWLERPESQEVKQYAAWACFHTNRLFDESERITTGGYIVQALYELMYCDLRDASPAYGFVAQPGKEPYWLDRITEEGVPTQSLDGFGFNEPYAAPMLPSETELHFIWHEAKSEWSRTLQQARKP
ncbi:uncharacterized protein MYCFIDRAFT_174320 [Pseudocercospora fijiensis CIRAD86]|uniref:Uncharacterized protein n=1 Tax=Pseudocercospora fijiensis (strain CIRAD86) TaxID=383855 RepID=M2YYS6_PSEFD|nr:uncharacterized protein MYCFIDRAFT_174320 [Pseudocercospora fijiensis CIRAD86]EME82780.1 hypothetical protein MYCFIDRAFT_174320 [Pseudocercospora fijiensis CIRAD86]